MSSPGQAVAELVEVMDRLRSPGGCPWDAEQSHDSLVKYLVEETYEFVDAVADADPVGMREELGDLLLQIVFHARIAQEDRIAPFGLAEIADGIAGKLRHRHPHVFGDVDVTSVAQVEENWERLKLAEKGRAHPLDGIPASLPTLARAAKVVDRLNRSGLSEALDTPASQVDSANDDDATVAVGRAIFDLVVRAHRRGIDPDAALRAHVQKVERTVREAQEVAG